MKATLQKLASVFQSKNVKALVRANQAAQAKRLARFLASQVETH